MPLRPQGVAGFRPKLSTHVSQGEVFVTRDLNCQVGMVLGSCVAAVMWDPGMSVGGVNHLLLPPPPSDPQDPALGAQVNLMERLINGVLAAGGRRGSLHAKVFGGARMISGLSDAGLRNGAFVTTFLADEGIPCNGKSLGGDMARRLRIWPATGKVMQRRLLAQASHVVGHQEAKVTGLNRSENGRQMTRNELLRRSGVELL